MKATIYTHRYTLHSKQSLNSRSQATAHQGALIRLERAGLSGYGCLHPWEALGDPSLEECLSQLGKGAFSGLVHRALHCAELDRQARIQGFHLLEQYSIPDSHATIVGGLDQITAAVERGFDTVKIKMSPRLSESIQRIHDVCALFPTLRLRLDFNQCFTTNQINTFLAALDVHIRAQIDFLEDPCEPNQETCKQLTDDYRVKYAVDREVEKHAVQAGLANNYFILKPAINDSEKCCKLIAARNKRVIVTSYMDHPIGQCYAAYMAGFLCSNYPHLINDRCGLMTHDLYQPTEFTELMGQSQPQWNIAPTGTGLGFDLQLDQLKWTRL